MRVDEARHDVAPARVQLLGPFVLPEPGDEAVHDRDIGFEPLPREDGENAAAAHDEICGLVSPRNRQPPRELVHGATIPRPRAGGRFVLEAKNETWRRDRRSSLSRTRPAFEST